MKKVLFFALFTMLGINAIAQKAKPFIKQFEYTINAGFGTTASSDPYDPDFVIVSPRIFH